MKKKALNHRADGHYFLGEAMLRSENACRAHRVLWTNTNGPLDVPVTLENLSRHNQLAKKALAGGNGMYWLLEHMVENRKITREEFAAAVRTYCGTCDPVEEARAVMNALLSRAKREGRIQ